MDIQNMHVMMHRWMQELPEDAGGGGGWRGLTFSLPYMTEIRQWT